MYGVQFIGVGACVLGDMSSRPNWGLYELDFVFSTLVVSLWRECSALAAAELCNVPLVLALSRLCCGGGVQRCDWQIQEHCSTCHLRWHSVHRLSHRWHVPLCRAGGQHP